MEWNGFLFSHIFKFLRNSEFGSLSRFAAHIGPTNIYYSVINKIISTKRKSSLVL